MTSIQSIDLNADLGEHDGDSDAAAADAAMFDVVSSASIACGAHAGSAEVMSMTVEAALMRGVSIGAHPSYPDRAGFGRRDMDLTLDALIGSVQSQIDALDRQCDAAGARLTYVKPHGALYNKASRDPALAAALADCVREIDPDLVMLALAGSSLEDESVSAGLVVAREAFIDRAYMKNGTLVPRDRPRAVLDDADEAADRALEMARDNFVVALDGTPLSIQPDSLCVHGDSANALGIVSAARRRLEEAGFIISPFAR